MDQAAIDGLAKDFDLVYDRGLHAKPDELARLAAGARALIVRNQTQVRGALLEAAKKLVVVGRLGVGLDNIDLTACKARGIAVRPATGANDDAVAEWVVACALILSRRAFHSAAEMTAGRWPREALMGREIGGKTLGLIGYGAIARATAARARALGMAVLAHDPHLDPNHFAWTAAGRRELDALLAESDVVSLHVPLTAETKGMLGAAQFARCKPGAILLNASRGGVLDEAALAAALKSGRLGGAALDVYAEEPLKGEAAARFAGVPNLILTPHIGGVTEEANARVSAVTAANVRAALAGKP